VSKCFISARRGRRAVVGRRNLEKKRGVRRGRKAGSPVSDRVISNDTIIYLFDLDKDRRYVAVRVADELIAFGALRALLRGVAPMGYETSRRTELTHFCFCGGTVQVTVVQFPMRTSSVCVLRQSTGSPRLPRCLRLHGRLRLRKRPAPRVVACTIRTARPALHQARRTFTLTGCTRRRYSVQPGCTEGKSTAALRAPYQAFTQHTLG
jgi:hypothetical protein